MSILTPEQEWDFLRKIAMFPDENGCLNWQGSTRGGYGRFRVNSSVIDAHRVAWALKHNRWPTEYICHRCDIKSCVNPTHLYEGSQHQNMIDKSYRTPRNNALRFIPQEVLEVREMLVSMTQREVARIFEVDQSTISRINTGSNWSHL